MKLVAKATMCFLCLAVLPIAADAQSDPFGVPDTVWADVAQIDDYTMSVTISYFNDEYVVGLVVPLKLDAGLNKIVADSAIYTGGRVAEAKWAYPGFRADTAIQTVTLGMMANIGPTNHRLTAGKGRVVTVFVSSLEGKKIENFTVDTTTTPPGNTLMAVSPGIQGEPPNEVEVDITGRTIFPQWVVRYEE
jgi:hypothetical protein